MRRRIFFILAPLWIAAGGGCTAFIAAELSGNEQTDASAPIGGCFQLTNNACGQCIATACEKPNATPPVSLAAICNFNTTDDLIDSVGACSQAPDLVSNDSCSVMFIDGGTYAPSLDTQAEAENNLRHCITDNCSVQCQPCVIPVPKCENDMENLAEAGACGACLDQALNATGGACRTFVTSDTCYESTSNPISKCAVVECTTPDCSGLQTPDPQTDDAGYSLLSCLWQTCQGSCPNQ